MSIEIRPARPEDFSNELADLHWSVDEPVFEYLCRSREDWHRMFAADWPHQDGITCHAWTHLAVEEGRVLGFMIGHDATFLKDRHERSLDRWRSTESAEMADHLDCAFSMLERLFPHPSDNSYYVLHLAVDARARKAGTGRRLMEVAETRARMLGRSSLHLDMRADNPAAEFYRRLGMEVEIETRLPALERSHGIGLHCHWVKVLN